MVKKTQLQIVQSDDLEAFACALKTPRTAETLRKLYREAVHGKAFKCAELLLNMYPKTFSTTYLKRLRGTVDFLSGDPNSESVLRVEELLSSAKYEELLKFCFSSKFSMVDYEHLDVCFLIDVACATPLETFKQIFEHPKFANARVHYNHSDDSDNFLSYVVLADRADVLQYVLASRRADEILQRSPIDAQLIRYSFEQPSEICGQAQTPPVEERNCLKYFIQTKPDLVAEVAASIQDDSWDLLPHKTAELLKELIDAIAPKTQPTKPKPKSR